MKITKEQYGLVKQVNDAKKKVVAFRKQERFEKLKEERSGGIYTERGRVQFDFNYEKKVDQNRFWAFTLISWFSIFLILHSYNESLFEKEGTFLPFPIFFIAMLIFAFVIPRLLHKFTFCLTECEK
jgi:hypothetical protein